MLQDILQYIFSETKEFKEIKDKLRVFPVGGSEFLSEFLFTEKILKYLYKIESEHENLMFNKRIDGIRALIHQLEGRLDQEAAQVRTVFSKKYDNYLFNGISAYKLQWDIVLTTFITIFYSNGFKILEYIYQFLLYSDDYFSIEDVTNSIKKAEEELNLTTKSLTKEWKYLLSLQTPRKI